MRKDMRLGIWDLSRQRPETSHMASSCDSSSCEHAVRADRKGKRSYDSAPTWRSDSFDFLADSKGRGLEAMSLSCRRAREHICEREKGEEEKRSHNQKSRSNRCCREGTQ